MPRARAVIASPAPRVQCLVCGCADVRTDEVLQGELIYLAECPRCDFRWTSRAPRAKVRIVAVRQGALRVPEPATAA